MMINQLILIITYSIFLILICIFFYKSVRHNKTKMWITLFITEFISIISTIIILFYYVNTKGTGILPGLSNLFEIMISFFAVVIYLIISGMSLVTLCLKSLLSKTNKYKNKTMV